MIVRTLKYIHFRIGEFGGYPSFWLGLVYADTEEWNWLDGSKVDTSIT